MNPLRISARLLAEFTSPWFCRRCYWLKLRMKGKLPFQFFPGVFSCFDSMQKRLTWLHWERHNKPPSWLESFGDISDLIQPPHWSKFHLDRRGDRVLLQPDRGRSPGHPPTPTRNQISYQFTGCSTNGREAWKDHNDVSLNEHQEREARS